MMSQRSARQNDPHRLQEIKRLSQDLSCVKVAVMISNPRSTGSIAKISGSRTRFLCEKFFRSWKFKARTSMRRRVPLIVQSVLKRRLHHSYWQILFRSFTKWKTGDSADAGNSQNSAMIEQIDEALVKNQSMIAAQMQASLNDKTESIKFKAKD